MAQPSRLGGLAAGRGRSLMDAGFFFATVEASRGINRRGGGSNISRVRAGERHKLAGIRGVLSMVAAGGAIARLLAPLIFCAPMAWQIVRARRQANIMYIFTARRLMAAFC